MDLVFEEGEEGEEAERLERDRGEERFAIQSKEEEEGGGGGVSSLRDVWDMNGGRFRLRLGC